MSNLSTHESHELWIARLSGAQPEETFIRTVWSAVDAALTVKTPLRRRVLATLLHTIAEVVENQDDTGPSVSPST